MDKRNHFYLVLLQENNPFFCCLDQFLFHSQASQIPTGCSKDVGKEYPNAIHFRPSMLFLSPVKHRVFLAQKCFMANWHHKVSSCLTRASTGRPSLAQARSGHVAYYTKLVINLETNVGLDGI
jgi:hypothetical protein